MSMNFIHGYGWGSLFGLCLSLGLGMGFGMPMEIWLRLALHFVSATIIVTLLITFMERGQPVSLCLAAYGALLVVVWSGIDLLTSFAELHHELQDFSDSSHIQLPADWWQSPLFWPDPVFIGLFLMIIAVLMIIINPPR